MRAAWLDSLQSSDASAAARNGAQRPCRIGRSAAGSTASRASSRAVCEADDRVDTRVNLETMSLLQLRARYKTPIPTPTNGHGLGTVAGSSRRWRGSPSRASMVCCSLTERISNAPTQTLSLGINDQTLYLCLSKCATL